MGHGVHCGSPFSQAPGYTIKSDDDLVEATFVFPNTRRGATSGSLRHGNSTGYHAAAAAAAAVASAAVPVIAL